LCSDAAGERVVAEEAVEITSAWCPIQ